MLRLSLLPILLTGAIMIPKITTTRGSGTIAETVKHSLIVERRTQDDASSITTDRDIFFSNYFMYLCGQNYNLGQFRK